MLIYRYNDVKTMFKIYKKLCKILEIEYPLKQSEISSKIDKLIGSLEYSPKDISRDENMNIKDEIYKAYFKIYRMYGSNKIDSINDKLNIFAGDKYLVNITTLLTILYLSGYRNDKLINRLNINKLNEIL